MNLSEIKAAIADRLKDIDGLRPFAYPIEEPPAGAGDVVAVRDSEPYIDYQQSFKGGLAFVFLTLRLYVQASDLRSAYLRRDALASSGTGEARSIIDALMLTDRTFGGLCSDVVVLDADNVELDSATGGVRYLTTDIGLRVLVGRL